MEDVEYMICNLKAISFLLHFLLSEYQPIYTDYRIVASKRNLATDYLLFVNTKKETSAECAYFYCLNFELSQIENVSLWEQA